MTSSSSNIIKKRESNFELLRIISMMMIVTLHLLFNEGILNLDALSSNYILGWSLESLFIVASNIYVLISGYFLINSHFSFKKVLKIWLSVLVYSYGISFILYFFKNDFGLVYQGSNIKLCMFPVLLGEYWFVTCYLLLFMLSPFLNTLIKNLKKNEYRNLLILLSIVFVLLKFFFPETYTFDKTGGYGIIWFIVLYFFSGYIRLHYESKLNKYVYLFGFILGSALTFICKMLFTDSKVMLLNSYSNALYNYNAPFVLFASLCLFLFFREIRIKNETVSKFINKISTATFGVYLIHEQFFARTAIWQMVNIDNNKYLILYVILYVLLIYTVCTIIELIRLFIEKIFFKGIESLRKEKVK